MDRRLTPIFIDRTGRRWRRIRRVALVFGVGTTIIGLVLVATVALWPPMPPQLPLAVANNLPIARATSGKPGAYTRIDRLRVAYRRKLAAAIKQRGSPPSRPPEAIPALNVGSGQRPTRTSSIVAGFFVNWDDNSFASLKRNYDKLDWVIGEWAFISADADSLHLRVKPEVVELLNSRPAEERPSLFIMISNFAVKPGADSARGKFDPAAVRAFLGNPVARANAVRQLSRAVQQYGLAGTTLDMESFEPGLQPAVLAFAHELHDAMHGMGKLATQAVATGETDAYIKRAAAANDHLLPMLYDEHYSAGDPGPIASQRFYVTQARRFARLVSPTKLVLTVGAYGDDWNDAEAIVNHQA